MTRDEIIKLAREAAARHGHTLKDQPSPETVEFIVEFAALVAAAEREQCAQVCELIDTSAFGTERPAPNDCAAAIRARNNNA